MPNLLDDYTRAQRIAMIDQVIERDWQLTIDVDMVLRGDREI